MSEQENMEQPTAETATHESMEQSIGKTTTHEKKRYSNPKQYFA